jgi:pimeloyl-ACP methyl ester carboxylesterase
MKDPKERKSSKRRFTKRGVLRTLIVVLLLILMFYFVLWILFDVLQDDFLYQPDPKIRTTPDDIGLCYEDVTFDTSDGETLHGWYIPKENASFVVLYCHGNTGNVGGYMQNYRILHHLGYDVFPFDYRGYGKSTGEPTEKGTYRDVRAAWTYLTLERNFSADRVIIYGRSMGGPIAAWLGARVTPGALILESTFATFNDLVDDFFFFLPVSLLSRFDYPTREYVTMAECPILVIHSEDDMKIGDHHGKRIYRSAHEPKEYLEINGGHPDCYLTSEKEYSEGIESFERQYLSTPSPR